MVSASWLAVRDSSGLPKVASTGARVSSDLARPGWNSFRAGHGQLPVDADGFLSRGQSLFGPPQLPEIDRQFVQIVGHVVWELLERAAASSR
jgi:hypothetical protein